MIAHNGALSNFFPRFREELEEGGAIFSDYYRRGNDRYTIARQRLNTGTIEQAVELAMDKLEGAYSLIIMTPGKLVGARDPQGLSALGAGESAATAICWPRKAAPLTASAGNLSEM